MRYNLGRVFYQNLIGLLLFLICFLLPLSAQAENIKADPSLLKQLKQITSDRADIAYHSKTGYVRFMGTDLQNPIPTGLPSDAAPEDAARAFLSTYGKLFGITNQKQELAVMREKTIDGNRSFVRFQQKHNGIPVLGGELNVQTDAGKNIVSANGKVLPGLSVDVTPKISAADAIEKAIAVVAKTHSIDASELSASSPELWIYNPIMLKPARNFNSLVWRMDVTPNRLLPIRELVLVDAHTGIVALHFNQIDTVLNRAIYDCANNPACVLPGTLNRSEGGALSAITEVNRAYNYSGDTYNFYWNNHARDSIDGAGMQMRSTTRYCPLCPTPYQNAFWNGSQMVYGAGYVLQDVAGHEITHGVTDIESRLFYYYQSGAINESLSDVWGEFIDLTYADDGSDLAGVRWLIGEDLSGGAIRSMSNPPVYGDPDRIGSTNYTCDTNEQDAGGVHTNSGVNNKAAYLMVDGGTFNGYTVTALGITKVAKIYYEAQTNLLLSASDYNDLYNALIQACTNLIGTSGITAADCVEVTDAVNAVQMNGQPAFCSATEATLCPTGSPNNLFFDNLENTTSGNWAAGAISGSNGWYYPQNPNAIAGFDATYATSGQYNFWGYNRDTIADYYIRMTSNIPLPTGSTLYMHFNHAYGFEDDATYAYDGGVFEYSTNSGSTWNDAGSSFISINGYNGAITIAGDNPLGGRNAFVRESNGYISSRFDISSLAGQQNVRFRFRIGTDSSVDDYGWFIDDIRIYTCVTTTSPPTAPSGLTATVASTTQVNLSWTDNSHSPDETGFMVERRIGAIGVYSEIATVAADVATFSNTGLTTGTAYYYRVRAYNANGNSAYSNEVSATPQAPPPPSNGGGGGDGGGGGGGGCGFVDDNNNTKPPMAGMLLLLLPVAWLLFRKLALKRA
jgi:Zn-dependent metalloprotease